MKTWPAIAVSLILAVAPSWAQGQPAPAQNDGVQLELLELEQDVDKTLLREAMLLRGRKGLVPPSERPISNDDRRREVDDTLHLAKYIERKKEAIAERSATLKVIRGDSIRPRPSTQVPKPTNPPAEADRQRLIEEYQNAQVEVQLLQTQAQMYQQPLQEAIQALAAAEFAASTDPTQKDKAEAARKQYQMAKAKFVEFSTRLQLEQTRIGEAQSRYGVGGMGGMGMMGGMGGGMM